jgi:hypothetical protein
MSGMASPLSSSCGVNFSRIAVMTARGRVVGGVEANAAPHGDTAGGGSHRRSGLHV